MKSRAVETVALVVGLLLAWQLLSLAVGPYIVSTPAATILRAVELLQSESFWGHAASTGTAFALACVIAVAGGVLVGAWLGLRRFAGDVADPILGTLYSIPKITLYPIILLVFGLSLSATVAFGVIHGIFPVAIFTMNGLRNVAPVHRKTARMLRLSQVATVATILVPAALPEILTGIRIGFAVTLLGTLIAELFASTSGIGVALIRATDVHNVVDIHALTLLLFIFAAGANALLHFVERRMQHHGR
jgi:NitT/TauT family transport system permease protein